MKLYIVTIILLVLEAIFLFTNMYWFIWLALPTAVCSLFTLMKVA